MAYTGDIRRAGFLAACVYGAWICAVGLKGRVALYEGGSGEIVSEASAGTSHHIMRTAFTGLLGLGIFKNMAQEFGVHLLNREIIDLPVILNIAHLKIVERETIEAVSLGVDVHRAVVGTPEIHPIGLPFANVGNRLAPVINKPLDQGVFLLLNFIQETGGERAVEAETHLREILEKIDHDPPHFGVVPNGQSDVLYFLTHNGKSGTDPDSVFLPRRKPEFLIDFIDLHALSVKFLFRGIQIQTEHQAMPVFA